MIIKTKYYIINIYGDVNGFDIDPEILKASSGAYGHLKNKQIKYKSW